MRLIVRAFEDELGFPLLNWQPEPRCIPVDTSTPEGEAYMRECMELAASMRPEKMMENPAIIMPFDEHGIFAPPIYRNKPVLMVLPTAEGSRNPRYQAFGEKFAELCLAREGVNPVNFICSADFAAQEGYRAVIWIRHGNEEPPRSFSFMSRNFALDGESRPVFIFGSVTLELCSKRDLDSDFVTSRMRCVWKQCLPYARMSSEPLAAAATQPRLL